jgi:hypothetical protein
MPDTPEHRADMFLPTQKRREAGLPVWKRKIQLGDVFHNDEITFAQRRDAICKRIKASGWMKLHEEDYGFEMLLEELANVDNPDDFDYWWDQLYDYADEDRVWIDTINKALRPPKLKQSSCNQRVSYSQLYQRPPSGLRPFWGLSGMMA